MHHTYLIDGYNLIHALCLIQRQLAPGGLEESRRRLLDFLAEAFGSRAANVTIVFDAQHAPPGVKRLHEHHGLHIRFAPRKQSADDVIEALIEAERQPDMLSVVSDDRRLQNAARQHGARALSNTDLLDLLEKREPARPIEIEEEKADHSVPEEMKHWLKEFGPLESDPEFKEFFDLDRFE